MNFVPCLIHQFGKWTRANKATCVNSCISYTPLENYLQIIERTFFLYYTYRNKKMSYLENYGLLGRSVGQILSLDCFVLHFFTHAGAPLI